MIRTIAPQFVQRLDCHGIQTAPVQTRIRPHRALTNPTKLGTIPFLTTGRNVINDRIGRRRARIPVTRGHAVPITPRASMSSDCTTRIFPPPRPGSRQDQSRRAGSASQVRSQAAAHRPIHADPVAEQMRRRLRMLRPAVQDLRARTGLDRTGGVSGSSGAAVEPPAALRPATGRPTCGSAATGTPSAAIVVPLTPSFHSSRLSLPTSH